MRAKIIKIGNSRGVRIPKVILEETGIKDEVEIIVKSDGLRIIPARLKRPIPETMLLSEPALAKDWDRPEEDEAWANL